MKVLMPFPYLEIFDRYFAQMKAISRNVSEFHVAYCSGQIKEEWKPHFVFHKFMDYPYNPARVGWKKNMMLLPYHLRRLLVSRMRINEVDVDVDLCYVLSSYWQQMLSSHFAEKHKIHSVCRVRGHLQYELNLKQSFLPKTFYFSSLRRNFKNSDLIIPITERVRNDLLYLGIQKDKISDPVGLGVDTKQFRNLKYPKNDKFIIGFFGRLSREKGIHRLIEMARKLPHIIFLVAGRKQTPIDFPCNVFYLGRIPHEQMPFFYNSVSAVIMPSFTEGFPNTVLEAYSCEIPILATKEALPSELKLFGLKGDFKDFPRMIEELRNSDLDSIGKEARSYVEKNHTWEKFGEEIVECFKHSM